MNFNEMQTKIIITEEPHVIINAAAGAGKTATLIERIRYLVHQGMDKEKIVAITFTTAAAEEMIERLGEDGYGIFIGTIHSYANWLLLSAGYDTSNLLEKEKYDELFEKVRKYPNCIKEVKYLLLDEGQDTGVLEWEFIFETINPKQYMVFASISQSIYRWKKADPTLILKQIEKEGVVTYPLLYNYRCGLNILNFAKRIVKTLGPKYVDHSIWASEEEGKVYEITYNEKNILDYVNTSIEKGHTYNEWFILCRTNAQVDKIFEYLSNNNIPCDTFKRSDLTNKELNNRMKSNTIKILTIHASKGLAANYVVVVGQKFYNEEEKCISYVAATRAKKILVWTSTPPKKKRAQITNWE